MFWLNFILDFSSFFSGLIAFIQTTVSVLKFDSGNIIKYPSIIRFVISSNLTFASIYL